MAQHGRYEAVRGPDGKWTVRGVPLFPSHLFTWEQDHRVRSFKVDAAWLKKCADTHAERERATGYLPQVHVGHHPDDDPRKELPHVGLLRITGVGAIPYDGEEAPCLVGDLTGISDARYAEIRDGSLPYLSVEAQLHKGLIRSCALLSSNAPAFPLPPITIAKETVSPTHPQAVVAFSASGVGARAVTRLAPMSDPVKPADPAPAAPTAPPPVEKAADAPATPAPATPAPSAPGGEMPTWAQRLCDMMAKLCDAVMGAGKEKQPDNGAPVDVPGAAMAYADAKELAALKGEVAALKGSLDAEKSERALAAECATAAKDLLAKYAVAETIEADLLDTARKHGAAAMRVQVEAIKKNGRAAPAGRLEDVGGAVDSVVPAEVMKYASDTAQMERALSLSREYDANRATGRCGDWTRERYIEVGLKRPSPTSAKARS